MKAIRKRYIFAKMVKPLFQLIIPPLYNVKFDYKKLTDVKPPYFVVGNHTSFLDPFIMGAGNQHHINFVTNDEYFRFPILKFLMKLLGAVPKTKFMSDYQTVKDIIRLRDEHAVIGIYPEGGRTWPGKTQAILYATSKLIKKMEIPVIGVLTSGGSLAFPRWAKHNRKGLVEATYFTLLTTDQIKEMSTENIQTALETGLFNDDVNWQRNHMVTFRGKKLAERPEWFLYACPKCGSFESMHSHDNKYKCSCGYQVVYTPQGFFETVGNDHLYYDNVNDWNDYQYAHMKQSMIEWLNNPESKDYFFCKENCHLYKGKRGDKELSLVLSGTLYVTKTGYRIADANNSISFDYDKTSGLIINHKNVIDFYHNSEKYRIKLVNKNVCGYIWEDAMKVLKELNNEKQ
jgi:1-acyl-sn-glycerol-3-phosphate acyltransferase